MYITLQNILEFAAHCTMVLISLFTNFRYALVNLCTGHCIVTCAKQFSVLITKCYLNLVKTRTNNYLI